ncbi:hypothetical protein CHAD_06350 [Corynebacterium hadale]|nr:hypothetical protein CHAD_06350 [Corynebacterium hadale]
MDTIALPNHTLDILLLPPITHHAVIPQNF